MKKKTNIAIILATTMMFALMGCGGTSLEVTESQTETNTDAESKTEVGEASEDTAKTFDPSATSDDASFEYKGKTLSFTDDAQAVIDALDSVGKPVSDIERESVEGIKWYDWDDEGSGNPNISMATQDDAGKVIIGYLIAAGKDFKTSKGISTGSSVEDVKAAYGEPSSTRESSSNAEVYYYKFDSYELSFFILEDEVDFVSYIHNNYKGL